MGRHLKKISFKHQTKFANSIATRPAIVGGLGSGKSEGGLARSLTMKYRYPKLDQAYYMPTYDLLKLSVMPRFEEELTKIGQPYKINKSDYRIYLEDKGSIIFRTMEKPERIIAYEVADSIVDEIDTLSYDKASIVWRKINERNRQRKQDGMPNTIGMITTPDQGIKGFTASRWHNSTDPDYELINASSYDNTYLPDGYIKELLKNYDEKQVQAFIYGKIVNMSEGNVYHQFDRDTHVIDNIDIDPKYPLIIAWDFNISPYNAVYLIQEIKGETIIIDNAIAKGKPVIESVRLLKSKFKHLGNQLFEATIYGDAAGQARQQGTAITNYAILRDEGFTHQRIKRANPRIDDRFNAVNARMKNGLGEVRLKVCKRNAELINDLELLSYNERGDVDKSNKALTHDSDSIGYYIEYMFGMNKSTIGAQRISMA